MYLIGPTAASFSLCLLAMFALRPLAIAVDLIDRPGGRKSHIGDVPVVGGLGMLLGMILGLGLVPLPDDMAGTLLAASAVLVTVGLIDDKFDLSPWSRLSAQVAAAILLIFGAGASVLTIGEFFGHTILLTGPPSHFFTIFIVVAAINAFNMLDGMDGLAGALAIVALAALAFIAQDGGNAVALAVSLVVMGAVFAFLMSNLPLTVNRPVRCFMGDSGSMLLGFVLAWLCIDVSQAQGGAASPVTMLWIVAIPLYELVWTVIRRTVRGIPPFRSDQGHLHHIVQAAGVGVPGTFILFFVLATVLAVTGIVLDQTGVSDSWSLALLAGAGVLIIRLLYIPRFVRKLVPTVFLVRRTAIQD